jgi:hypothetical protein
MGPVQVKQTQAKVLWFFRQTWTICSEVLII